MLKNYEIKICKKCQQVVSPARFISNQTYYKTNEGYLIIIEKSEGIVQACLECLNCFIKENEKYFLSKTDFPNRTIITFKKSFSEKFISLFKRKKTESVMSTGFTINTK